MPKGQKVHVLTNKNIEERTADCAKCGHVRIAPKRQFWQCINAKKEHRGSSNGGKGVYTPGAGWMSVNERTQKIGRQSGRCAICQKEVETLHRDHCHATGKDRAFLCRGCNVGLGNFGDNPEILEAAAAYLRWHGTPYEFFRKT